MCHHDRGRESIANNALILKLPSERHTSLLFIFHWPKQDIRPFLTSRVVQKHWWIVQMMKKAGRARSRTPSVFIFCPVLSTLPRQLQNNLILLGVSHRFVISLGRLNFWNIIKTKLKAFVCLFCKCWFSGTVQDATVITEACSYWVGCYWSYTALIFQTKILSPVWLLLCFSYSFADPS